MPIIQVCGACGVVLQRFDAGHFSQNVEPPKACPHCHRGFAGPNFERVQVTTIDPGTPWVLSS